MQNQVYIFLIFILNGFLIGILFDSFRILRKSFKTPNFVTGIEDIAFWVLTGLMLIYSIFKFTDGNLRIYIFLGVLLGYVLYLLIFSRIYINISVYIILFIKRIIHYLVILPITFVLRILHKIIIKPLAFVFNKVFRKMSYIPNKLVKKIKKGIFSKKIAQEKKDFA